MTEHDHSDRTIDPFGEQAAPVNLHKKVINQLEYMQILKKQVPIYRKLAALVLVAVITFLTGWGIGVSTTVDDDRHLDNRSGSSREFVLLTINTLEFVENEDLVKEYGQWFSKYNKDGYVETGGELREIGWSISGERPKGVPIDYTKPFERKEYVSGFFILHVPDAEKAFEIANTCPHLKHNGKMELREIKL